MKNEEEKRKMIIRQKTNDQRTDEKIFRENVEKIIKIVQT